MIKQQSILQNISPLAKPIPATSHSVESGDTLSNIAVVNGDEYSANSGNSLTNLSSLGLIDDIGNKTYEEALVIARDGFTNSIHAGAANNQLVGNKGSDDIVCFFFATGCRVRVV